MTDKQHDFTLTPDQAEAVIVEARKDKLGEGPIYSGSMPDSPEKRIEVGDYLVDAAITAWVSDNMRGVEVADILRAAGISFDDQDNWSQDGSGSDPEPEEERAEAPQENPTTADASQSDELVTMIGPDGTTEVTVPESNVEGLEQAGFTRKADEQEPEVEQQPDTLTVLIGGTPVTLPYENAKALVAAGQAEEVEPESSEPEPDASQDDVPNDADPVADDGDVGYEEPWDGYDGLKDTEIRALMENMTDEEIEYVKGYEATKTRPRKRILAFEKGKARKKKADEPAPADDSTTEEGLDKQFDERVEADPDPQDSASPPGTPEDEQIAGTSDEFINRDEEQDRAGEGHRAVGSDESEVEHRHEGETRYGSVTAEEERILAQAEVEKARLPIPNDELEAPPEFPEDVSSIPEGELFALHSRFNACLALANWKLGLFTVDERAFKHIAEKRKLAHLRGGEIERIDSNTGRPKAQDRYEAEAEQQNDVQEMRDKQHLASQRALMMRKLVEIYAGHVDVLSRQWTFRERELGSSGSLAPRARKAEQD